MILCVLGFGYFQEFVGIFFEKFFRFLDGVEFTERFDMGKVGLGLVFLRVVYVIFVFQVVFVLYFGVI